MSGFARRFANAVEVQAAVDASQGAQNADFADSTDPAKGAALVGIYDGLAPAFLKVSSDLLNMQEVSVLRFIAPAKWAGIAAETNADDLSASFVAAFAASAKGVNLFVPHGLYNADRIAMPYGNSSMRGERGAQLRHTVAGRVILSAAGVAGVSVSGVQFAGLGSATVPLDSIGGFAASSSGLLTFAGCTDASVERCAFDGFYSGLSALNCTGLDVTRNRVTNWMLYGVLASLSKRFNIDHNYLVGCNQAGAANAYGISATGDENGGNVQQSNRISFNEIRGVPSWDGIMTHDVSGLKVVGNDIRDVRIGIDLGHVISSNFVRDLMVANNHVESTATNTWGATPALHAGIYVTGFDATHLVDGVQVQGNLVKGFFKTAGMVGAGSPSNIVVQYAKRASVIGNTVRDAGSVIGNSGVYVVGNNDGIVVSANVLEGVMAAGAVRFAAVVADSAVIAGNTIKQTTPTDPAIQITGSTIASLAMDANAHNSSVPFVQSGSALTQANSGAFTATLTGCTTAPTENCQWAINGGVVTLTLPSLAATSNSTGCTLTGLPAFLWPFANSVSCPIAARDNGVFTNDVTASITVGSGTITLQRAGSSAGWANTGTKGPYGSTITYALN